MGKDNAPYSLGRDQDKALNDMRIALFEFVACGLRQNSAEHLTDLYEVFCEHWSDIFHTFIDVFATNGSESELSLIAAGAITELFSIVSNTTDSSLASYFEKILRQMLDQCTNSRDKEKTNGQALAEVLDDKVLKTLMRARAVNSQLKALGAFASALQTLIVNSKSAAEVLSRSVTTELLIEELMDMDQRIRKMTMVDVAQKKDTGNTLAVAHLPGTLT